MYLLPGLLGRAAVAVAKANGKLLIGSDNIHYQ
jgi:hypothetical protein